MFWPFAHSTRHTQTHTHTHTLTLREKCYLYTELPTARTSSVQCDRVNVRGTALRLHFTPGLNTILDETRGQLTLNLMQIDVIASAVSLGGFAS